jgi:alcohol dehydrogenase class IV
MPARLTASTGFDAFTHAYERFFATAELSPFLHQLSVRGMQIVIDYLERAVRDSADREARSALSWAATQNGMVVVAEGGEAALHIFGLPIGAVSHVPHGQALAIVTEEITRRHTRRVPQRARELAALFEIDATALDGQALEEALASALVEWIERIGLPATLGGHGIDEREIPRFREAISRTRLANVFAGYGDDEIDEVYRESL